MDPVDLWNAKEASKKFIKNHLKNVKHRPMDDLIEEYRKRDPYRFLTFLIDENKIKEVRHYIKYNQQHHYIKYHHDSIETNPYAYNLNSYTDNKRLKYHGYPIHYAARYGSYEMMVMLISQWYQNPKMEYGDTPIWALKRSSPDSEQKLKLLLITYPPMRPLIWVGKQYQPSCSYKAHWLYVVGWQFVDLLPYVQNWNICDEYGYSPCMCAATEFYSKPIEETLEPFIKQGFDINFIHDTPDDPHRNRHETLVYYIIDRFPAQATFNTYKALENWGVKYHPFPKIWESAKKRNSPFIKFKLMQIFLVLVHLECDFPILEALHIGLMPC